MQNQLTIIDQLKDIETKSGVQFELNITEVVSLATRAKAVTSVEDPNFYTIKKECQQKRKYISDYFFDARAEFNKLSKGVIEVEKIVLAEFTEEENRLVALDKAEKERLITEARLEALPAKRERITASGVEFTDEEILAMTDADFELEFAKRFSAKAISEQAIAEEKLAQERAAFEAEKAELARKQAEADRIEQARIEERERLERQAQLLQESAERDLREYKERAEREIKLAEERRKAEEQERVLRLEREEAQRIEQIKADTARATEAQQKQEADKKYQAFLAKNKYNSETDMIITTDDNPTIYRLVAKFK